MRRIIFGLATLLALSCSQGVERRTSTLLHQLAQKVYTRGDLVIRDNGLDRRERRTVTLENGDQISLDTSSPIDWKDLRDTTLEIRKGDEFYHEQGLNGFREEEYSEEARVGEKRRYTPAIRNTDQMDYTEANFYLNRAVNELNRRF